jgi:hypothetical protein
MDTILVTVTALSLVMAAIMGTLLVRLLHEERRRSDARVALLEQLATEPRASGSHTPVAATAQQGSTVATVQRGSTLTSPGHRVPARIASSRSPAAVTLDDLELRPGNSVAEGVEHEMFHEHGAPSAWPRRFVVVGAMAAVMAAVLFGWSATQPATELPTGQATAGTGQPPLELLSLQHAQQEGTLVISGLVQNPRSGAALAGIQATVLLFGADDRTVATGRAPLDFTTLAPGDESPFVIRVPVTSAVTRYRVGFRSDTDRVLGHIDRRNPETVARKQEP